MPKTKPFAELAAKVKADPVRRAWIEAEKQVIRDVLSLAEPRARQNETQRDGEDDADQAR